MKMKLNILSLAFLLLGHALYAGNHDPKVIIPLLKDAKITLLQGIAYAEESSGIVRNGVRFDEHLAIDYMWRCRACRFWQMMEPAHS